MRGPAIASPHTIQARRSAPAPPHEAADEGEHAGDAAHALLAGRSPDPGASSLTGVCHCNHHPSTRTYPSTNPIGGEAVNKYTVILVICQ